MSSADHEDLRIDACQIMQAGNGGYVVLPTNSHPAEMRIPLASFTTKNELSEWLLVHLN